MSENYPPGYLESLGYTWQGPPPVDEYPPLTETPYGLPPIPPTPPYQGGYPPQGYPVPGAPVVAPMAPPGAAPPMPQPGQPLPNAYLRPDLAAMPRTISGEAMATTPDLPLGPTSPLLPPPGGPRPGEYEERHEPGQRRMGIWLFLLAIVAAVAAYYFYGKSTAGNGTSNGSSNQGNSSIAAEKDLTLPATLAGQPKVLDAPGDGTMQRLTTTIRHDVGNHKTAATLYGSQQNGILVVAARTQVDPTKELAVTGMGTTAQQTGNSMCVTFDGGATLCLRTAANLTVEVLDHSATMAQTAELVDQIWATE